MSLLEAITVIVGLFAGYWVVSKFFFKSNSSALPAPGAPSWHEVLHISPTASIAEIEAAYRQLISQYHPDKVAQLGPELRALAERKSQDINLAYENALKSRRSGS